MHYILEQLAERPTASKLEKNMRKLKCDVCDSEMPHVVKVNFPSVKSP